MLNTNEEVNKEIGDMFLNDSQSFLERSQILLKNIGPDDMGRRCKLLIDIRFAIECALKALIFYESHDDEQNTYNRVKKIGHKLKKLFNAPEVHQYCQFHKHYNEIKGLHMDDYDVFLRYSLETYIQFGPFDKKSDYYTLVENLMVNNKIFDIAEKIYNEVEQMYHTQVKSIPLGDTNPEKLNELEQRIVACKEPLPTKQPLWRRILMWMQQLWQKICCFLRHIFCKK